MCKVEGLLKILPVTAFVVSAVTLHIFKVVPPAHGKKKLENMPEKILAPLVHPRHFAQYCIDGSCTHWVIVLRVSCAKLKLRTFTLLYIKYFHGLLICVSETNFIVQAFYYLRRMGYVCENRIQYCTIATGVEMKNEFFSLRSSTYQNKSSI